MLSIPLEAGPPCGEGSSSKNILSLGGFVAKARSLTLGHVEGQQLLTGGRFSEGCPAGGVNLQSHRQVSCDGCFWSLQFYPLRGRQEPRTYSKRLLGIFSSLTRGLNAGSWKTCPHPGPKTWKGNLIWK